MVARRKDMPLRSPSFEPYCRSTCVEFRIGIRVCIRARRKMSSDSPRVGDTIEIWEFECAFSYYALEPHEYVNDENMRFSHSNYVPREDLLVRHVCDFVQRDVACRNQSPSDKIRNCVINRRPDRFVSSTPNIVSMFLTVHHSATKKREFSARVVKRNDLKHSTYCDR